MWTWKSTIAILHALTLIYDKSLAKSTEPYIERGSLIIINSIFSSKHIHLSQRQGEREEMNFCASVSSSPVENWFFFFLF